MSSKSKVSNGDTAMCHITTVHSRTDVRIRFKEVASLASALDAPVILFVQDGLGDEIRNTPPIKVIDTGHPPLGRLARMTRGSWRMYCAVRQTKPRVVHFHDPELIFAAFALKLTGVNVIYDVHEDLPSQILQKQWLLVWLRRGVSRLMASVEWLAGGMFEGVVTATPTIARRFPDGKTVTVQNFPIKEELVAPESVSYSERLPHFAYVGGITAARGSFEMVTAIGRMPDGAVRLQLAGKFFDAAHDASTRALPGWSRVDFHGWADRATVAELLGRVRAGLVMLHPTANYPDAFPVKLFEYMAAGLPVIASDFPLWREIVDGAGCGLLVDPLDPEAIAEAMQWLLDHPDQAEAMGQRGRAAVESTYNWQPEAEKLLDLYRRILGEETDAESKETRFEDG